MPGAVFFFAMPAVPLAVALGGRAAAPPSACMLTEMRTWPRLGPTALAAEETLSPPATRLIASSFGAIGLERYWALSGSWRGSALVHLDIVPLSGYPSCAVNSAIENSP